MNQSVLIVGAGPSGTCHFLRRLRSFLTGIPFDFKGLMLALALLRNGISVRIITQEANFVVGQRGAGVMPRSLEIYKFMGLLPEILAMARPIPAMQLLSSPQGEAPIKTVNLNKELSDTPFYPYINPLILGQDRHEGFLRKHLLEEYNVTVELATKLVYLEQHPDYVTAQILKTVDGKEVTETATFEWLVGADGAHSTVRKQLGIPFRGVTREEQILLIGDIQVKKGLGDRNIWPLWGNNWLEKMAAMRPYEIDGDDRFTFMVGGSEIDHSKAVSSREEFIRTFYEISGRTDIEFGELVWMGLWRPNIRMADRFGEGRVFIVGDAAHVHTPAGGQGMNSGIQDSFNLAWKLALVQKGISSASILDSYTKERLPVIDRVLNNTTTAFDSWTKDGNNGQWSGWDFNVRQLGINYQGSPIVLDERYMGEVTHSDPYRSGDDGLLRGGDRAPEAPGLISVNDITVTQSLFDIFKPTHHTVLAFADPSDNQGELLKVPGACANNVVQVVTIYPQSTPVTSVSIAKPTHHAFVDAEGYAYKHYNITGPGATIYIIRPDGYIGAYTQSEGGVVDYFEKLFA
ncbi:FAD binding domain-containing protein [Collybia nuda]|uniref:FAD binding domain-containing protein n=1 Tax=Collybia nuda TaxID=64659 RepID=A0A9P5Y7Q3_9AGAR|nr:FAD binding domain-containing protein [Collybia nuda]